MKLFSAVFVILISVCPAELNLEATEGDNVTIHLETAELDRADQVTITLTRESKKKLIAQYCRCAQCGDCNVVETQRVLLQVKEGTLTLLDVRSRDSGLYEATIIVGNNVSKKNATLNVNKSPFSFSRAPPQTSISKPPNSSERQRLYVLIAPLVFIFVVLVFCFFCKCMKTCAFKKTMFVKKIACREDPEDQLGKNLTCY